MNDSVEHLQRRCPRLGCSVTWHYCRRETDGRPCFKVLDCWWEVFDVEDYLRKALSEAEFRNLCESRPTSKMAGLIELIRRAQLNTGGGHK